MYGRTICHEIELTNAMTTEQNGILKTTFSNVLKFKLQFVLQLNQLMCAPGVPVESQHWYRRWLCIKQATSSGILPKGPDLPCLRMADWTLLAGYPRHMGSISPQRALNSLTTGWCGKKFQTVFFYFMLWIKFLNTSYEIALMCMLQNPTDHKSTLVQVMAWCRQATSHYLSQCWPRYVLPYGITRPQWVKAATFADEILFA